jgi:ribose 1,5-bisphosphokinase
MAWEAHGLSYGVGAEIGLWRRSGLTVVVSGSRAHFLAELTTAVDVVPVMISADPDEIAKRIAARGRERSEAITERIRRGQDFAVAHPGLVTIDNSGPLERAGLRLADLIIAASRGT